MRLWQNILFGLLSGLARSRRGATSLVGMLFYADEKLIRLCLRKLRHGARTGARGRHFQWPGPWPRALAPVVVASGHGLPWSLLTVPMWYRPSRVPGVPHCSLAKGEPVTDCRDTPRTKGEVPIADSGTRTYGNYCLTLSIVL